MYGRCGDHTSCVPGAAWYVSLGWAGFISVMPSVAKPIAVGCQGFLKLLTIVLYHYQTVLSMTFLTWVSRQPLYYGTLKLA